MERGRFAWLAFRASSSLRQTAKNAPASLRRKWK